MTLILYDSLPVKTRQRFKYGGKVSEDGGAFAKALRSCFTFRLKLTSEYNLEVTIR